MRSVIYQAVPEDVDDVVDVERETGNTAYSRDTACDVVRRAIYDPQSTVYVAWHGPSEVAGVCRIFHAPAADRILWIGVREQYRRQGYGTGMLLVAISDAAQRRRPLVCDVRESDLSAQLFLRANGLVCKRINRGYFETPNEDSYCFIKWTKQSHRR